MTSICRICFKPMPQDRKGWEQVCLLCRKAGHEELLTPLGETGKTVPMIFSREKKTFFLNKLHYFWLWMFPTVKCEDPNVTLYFKIAFKRMWIVKVDVNHE